MNQGFRIRVSANDVDQPNPNGVDITVTELTEQFAVGFTKTQGVKG